MGVLLNFDLKGANITEKPDYYQRLIDNGLRLDIKNEKANCFKVNIYDGDILTATFLTEKQVVDKDYNGVIKKVGMTKDDFTNAIISNKITGFTENQFINALAQADYYLEEKAKIEKAEEIAAARKERITDMVNGIVAFHLSEIKEAVEDNKLPDLISSRVESGVSYLTGDELSEFLNKENIDRYSNYVLIDMSGQSSLIIQEKYGLDGLEYKAILMGEYEDIRKFSKIEAIPQMDKKELHSILNPKIEEYKEKVEQEMAEMNKSKPNHPTPFSKPTPY